jgi:putative aldouronate transport system permease protein
LVVRETTQDRVFNTVNAAVLVFVVLTVLYPLYFVAIASISDFNLVNSGEVWLLPRGATLEAYQKVLRYEPVWIGYRNTIFYTVFGTLINLSVTLTCAYSLSRRDFVGRSILTALFTFTMFFHGGLIPTFLLVKSLGMVDTIWAMLIPNAAAMWNIIITRTYFQTAIPFELQEAAKIDGCSNVRIFTTVVLPLSAPIVAVMALFYGVMHWNALFNALIYLSNRSLFPLQLFLREVLIQNQIFDLTVDSDQMESAVHQMQMAELMKYALIIVSSVPILMVYPFLQRYFVQGVLVGAVKG